MNSDTAHLSWETTWQSREGRADWVAPDTRVISCATRLRIEGARYALDLGCGIGRHALMMAALGFATSALDASESGLAELEENAQRQQLDITTSHGLMTDLPFADNTFDYVLSFNVIYHGAPDVVRSAISEVERVLKPGGTFQGTMLSKRRSDYRYGVEVAPDTFVQPDGAGDKSHPHFFCDAKDLVNLFSGFDIRSLEDVDGDSSWHWHLVAELNG